MMDRPLHRSSGGWAGVLLFSCLYCASATPAPALCPAPVSWESFAREMLSSDGRVIDYSRPDRRTTSEAQAYALFMALVWNDQARFSQILTWTRDNLAHGDLSTHLPAWLWGKSPNGDWKILDGNSASDADLWLSYTLLEAGRLWNKTAYRELGRQLADRIHARETVDTPVLGRVLLPGRQGFSRKDGTILVSPSYLPIQILRRLATLYPNKGWGAVLESSARILLSRANGLQSDWLEIDPHGNIHPESEKSRIGGYNALRTYLWAGMLSSEESWTPVLRSHFERAMTRFMRPGLFPEKIDTRTGKASGHLNPLLHTAILPMLHSLGYQQNVNNYCQRLGDMDLSDAGYYSKILALFSLGWLNGQYEFAADGRLEPAWKRT